MSVIVSHRGVAAQLTLHLQNDGQSAVVKINGKDFPVAFDMEDGKIMLRVWQRAGTDQPESIELEGYLNFTFERAVEKARLLAIAGNKTKLVVELDNDPNDRIITVVDEDYPDYDEFEAFDGKILATVSPDGGVEQ